MVKTGRSNIDLISSKVILEGNLYQEPKVQIVSKGLYCPDTYVNSVGAEEDDMEVLQLLGKVEVNTGSWLFPSWK